MAQKAFIVGINTLGLQYCERDAELMRRCLERHGYEVLTPEATKGDINDQFDDLLDSCGKTDTVVLYFSGHGLVKKGKLYFVLADDVMRSRNKVNLNDFVERFSDDCRASNKLLILDCCHANQSVVEWRPELSERYFILTASERLEKSKELDALQAGFLTHHLQQALNEPPPEIVAADKTIRLSALYGWLVAEAKRHNSLEHAIQVPLPNLLGNQKGDFALATLTAATHDLPQALSEEQRRRQAAEERYRALALESCDIIDLANLPEDRQVATRELELRRLYVPLRMRVEARLHDETAQTTFETLEERRRGLLSRDRPHAEAKKRVAVGARLRKARRLVVLGDPGAGKSTLLRWLATAYLLRLKEDPAWQSMPDVKTLPDEAWLPVLIRCRDLDPELCLYGSLHDILRRTFRKNEMVVESDALQALIEDKLKHGEALLLIDGLDEISNPSARIRLCQQIEQMERAYPKAPIIVTSRIVGYRDMGSYRIKESFEHLLITEFSGEDKEEFARRWCAITERPERRVKATDELIQAMQSNNRIERLTGNPMLLTTLALVKRKVGRLPSRRVDLYAEAVRVLLNWRSEVDEPLDYREAEPQLHYLAYAMCDQGVQQLREDEIIDLLHTMRQEYPYVHAIKNRPPYQFLHLLERRTGILVQIGHIRHDGEPKPVYEFRHLTFQEYLAGLALVKGYFPNRNKSLTLPDYVSTLAGRTTTRYDLLKGLFSDEGFEQVEDEVVLTEEWREALRLCVTACNDDDVDNVLNAILTPLPNEEATTTRPRAILAALCLADEPNLSQTMADKILQTFSNQINAIDSHKHSETNLIYAAIELASSRWGQKLRLYLVQEFCRREASKREPVGKLCGMVIDTTISNNDKAVRAWLAEQIPDLASDIEVKAIEVALGITYVIERRWIIRSEATQSAKLLMAMLHANGPKAHAAAWGLATLHNKRSKAWQPLGAKRERMIALVNDPDTDAGVVRWLASILGRERDSQAVEALNARLDNPHVSVRRAVAEALREIGEPQAVEALITCLDDPDVLVCTVAAEALGKIGDVQAVEPLIARLNNSDKRVRQAVAWALGEIGDVQAVEPLIARFDGRYESIHTAVAEALVKIGDYQAVEALIACLDGPYRWGRRAVAKALGEIGDVQAVKPLIACLDDSDNWVRKVVAEALGEIGDPQAVESLSARLDDPDKSVRKTVAEALGEIGNPQAVESLSARLDDPDKSVRKTVAEALVKIGDPQAVKPLIARLDDPDKPVRKTVAEALIKIGNPQAVKPLIARLDDPEANVRQAVAWTLGMIGNPQAVKPLIARLDDPEANVRQAVAWALGKIGHAQAVKPLIARLDDPEANVRQAVAWALGMIGHTQAVKPLIARLDDPEANLRQYVAEALGEIGDAQAVEPLIARLDDPYEWVRRAVAQALGEIGDAQAVEPLLARLDEEDMRVRKAVAEALIKIGDPQAVEPLITRLDDPDKSVRAVVGVVLGEIGDPKAISPLIARLNDPDEWVRRAVASALGEIGDRKAVEPLLTRLNDPDQWVRRAVASALGEIGNPKAVSPLIARLDDPEASVRRAVASALEKIGDARAVEPLIACLDDPDKSVRTTVAKALGEIGDIKAVEALSTCLDDSEAKVRQNVAWALGVIGDNQAVEPLIARLDDSESRLRQNVVSALEEIGDVKAVKPLITSLDDPEPSVRRAVASALGRIGDPQAVSPLLAGLDDPDELVVRVVGYALGDIGDIQAVESLIARLDDPEASVRNAVANALGGIGGSQALEPLIARLDDPDESVRGSVANALGEIGNTQAVFPLIARLDDPDESVRRAIAWALGEIRDYQSVNALISRLDDSDESVRRAIAWALGKIGNRQAALPLIARFDEPEQSIRSAIAWALGEIGDYQAVSSLLARLDDPDQWVGIAVAKALAKMSEPQGIEFLLAYLHGRETKIRSSVAWALGEIGDAQGISLLRERLSAHDSKIRREALAGLAQTCHNEIDRKLLSKYITRDEPFLDPQEGIGESQVRRATQKLNLSMEEVKRRYEALAVRFGLKLAWQAEGVRG